MHLISIIDDVPASGGVNIRVNLHKKYFHIVKEFLDEVKKLNLVGEVISENSCNSCIKKGLSFETAPNYFVEVAGSLAKLLFGDLD